ncbi:MAG: tryptophan--tRNA ligase [Ruminococcaceae bacterium]|nr:tryptophan--tRNA ligase [Oscillospiraceae bacterium]
MENENKQIVLSAIQPTGTPTLGNYLGALRNWKNMAADFDCLYAVADLHSITVRTEPKLLRQRTLDMYAILIALGLDPEKNTVFVQSHVPQHAQLGWILNCYTQFGEAARMTQFKDKSEKHPDNINVGLFDYPVLMAADILVYQSNFVPVGDDQKQHLELARDIATRFNGIYGDVLTVPEPFIAKTGAKIMSLQEPTKKMSKSDLNTKSFISILEDDNAIAKKIKSAVTDSEAKVRFAEGKDGVNNLMGIYSCCTGKSFDEIEKEFDGKGYGDFKSAVAEAVVEELRPLKEEYARLINDKAYLNECMKAGAEKASYRAERTLRKVMKKVGFYQV